MKHFHKVFLYSSKNNKKKERKKGKKTSTKTVYPTITFATKSSSSEATNTRQCGNAFHFRTTFFSFFFAFMVKKKPPHAYTEKCHPQNFFPLSSFTMSRFYHHPPKIYVYIYIHIIYILSLARP